jgi:hypothetical protein
VLPSPTASTVEPTATPSGEPLPTQLSPADDGRVFSMRVGETTNLVVLDPLATEPRIDGDSIELIAIVNVAPSGQREWEVQAVAVGRTTMIGGGSLPYVITIDVIEP